MREVISIHIGQAGVQMGNACWWELQSLHSLEIVDNEIIKLISLQGALLPGAWNTPRRKHS